MGVSSQENIDRILIVRTSHLGDCVRSLPLVRAVAERWPQARMAWAIQPEYAALIRGLGADRNGGEVEAIPIPRREGWRGTRRGLVGVRAFAPDLAIDAQGNAKSALIVAASRAGVRWGMAREHCREAWAGRAILNRRADSTPAGRPHARDRMVEMAEALGSELGAEGPELTPAERQSGRSLLNAWLGDQDRPRLAFASASNDPRSWPLERWQRALSTAPGPALVLGGPAESEALARLGDNLPAPIVCPSEPLELRPLSAVFAAAAERDGCLLGTDTGPVHLAASLGLRVLQLSGPTDPRRTGVWPDPAREAESPHRILGFDPQWDPRGAHARPNWSWPGPDAREIDPAEAVVAWFEDGLHASPR